MKTDEFKRIVIKKVVSAYKKFGIEKLKAEDTSIQEKIKEFAIKRGGAFNIEIDPEELE